MSNRSVEVFTAGCGLCAPVVEMVQDLACGNCAVTVHDLHNSGVEAARSYGISVLPAIVVDGRLLSCCAHGAPSRDELVAAGIGTSA